MDDDPSSSKPRWPSIALKAAAVLSIVLPHICTRILSWKQFFVSGIDRPLFDGSDSYYHAHRIGLLFENFPTLRFHDRFMAHPSGTMAEWPLGFDYSIAALLASGRLFGLEWSEMVWTLPFVTLSLSLITLWLFHRLLSTKLNGVAAWAGTVCLSLNLAFISTSSVGTLDHHVHEVLGAVLLMMLPRFVSSPAGSRRSAAAAGVGVALLVWCSTLLAFLLTAFLIVWFFTALATKNTSAPPHFSWFSLTLGGGVVLFGALEALGRSAFFSFATLSLLHVAAVILPLAAFHLLGRLRPLKLVLMLTAPAAIGLVLMPEATLWVVNFILGSDDFLLNLSEVLPIFMSREGPSFVAIHALFGVLYLLFPVAFVALRRWDKQSFDTAPPNWFVFGLFLLSFSQKRFAHLFAPGFVLILWTLVDTRIGRTKHIAYILALVLLLEPIAFFGRNLTSSMTRASRDAVEVALFLRSLEPNDDFGVAAPPNMGNAINFLAMLPATTNTFFYKRYLSFDLNLRSFTNDRELVSFLRENQVGYLVAADDSRYRTMLLGLFERHDEAKRFAQIELLPCSHEYMQFSYDRLACTSSRVPGLRLLQTLVFSRDPKRLMRRATIYEVLPP